jgi:DNA polymerase-1
MRMSDISNVKVHLVDSVDTAFEMMRWLSNKETIAIDTETTGLDTRKDTVRLVQIGGRDDGWAIPWDQWNGVFNEVINKFDGHFIMHNAKYDYAMLKRMGVEVPTHRIRDTRIMHHILDPTKSTALKSIAARLVDPRAANPQKELDDALGKRGGWTWATIPIDFVPYWSYGALDTVLTHRVYDELWPRIESETPYAFEIENDVQWVIQRMEDYGVFIDHDYAIKYEQQFMDYCNQVEHWCVDEYGIKPGSNKDVVRILQADGVDFVKATASGAVALDKEVLTSIDHPLAQAVLNRRQLQKLASTYLRHYIHEIDSQHLIHPSINTLGARTSRMSMQNPNFQNLPRKSEKNKSAEIIRNCVTTRYGDAGTLLMCDFDQIEMRGMAHLSRDQGLIDAFLGPDDFFVTLARSIYNDNSIIKSDPRRQITKNAGYAKIYGAGIAKFAITAGVTEDQAREVMNGFDTLYPNALRFQKRVQNEALQVRRETNDAGFVRCELTNRYHFADPGKEYALVNYLTQGMAAQIFKIKLIELSNAGLDEFMMLPVHDEIILDIPREHEQDVVTTLNDIMNDDKILSVPVTAGISIGKRWGEKKDYEP